MKSIPAPSYITNLLDLDDTILAGPETLSLPQASSIFTPEHAAIIRLNACRVRRFFSLHLNTDPDSEHAIPASFTNMMTFYIEEIRDLFKAKTSTKNARLMQMAILRCLNFYTAAQYDAIIERSSKDEDHSSMRMRKEEREEEEKTARLAREWAMGTERERQRELQMVGRVTKSGKGKGKQRKRSRGRRGGSGSKAESGSGSGSSTPASQ